MIEWWKPRHLDNDLWLAVRTRALARWDLLGRRRPAALLENVRTWCLFIGCPRSGHSVVGSMIDAHPDAAIAHRLDSLKYLDAGYDTTAIFHLILENSRRFAAEGRKLTGYRYDLPGQWQGRTRTLRVIGDQEGNWTARRLKESPALLDKLLGLPVAIRFIHVIRNPFDNITTWALRSQTTLELNIRRYFERCAAVEEVRRRAGGESILDVRHESFVGSFEPELRRVMDYLGLELGPDLLAACTQLIRPAPHKSRHNAAWTPSLIQTVEREMQPYAFLQGYSFDD